MGGAVERQRVRITRGRHGFVVKAAVGPGLSDDEMKKLLKESDTRKRKKKKKRILPGGVVGLPTESPDSPKGIGVVASELASNEPDET